MDSLMGIAALRRCYGWRPVTCLYDLLFCLISTGVPSIERGHQASLKTSTYVVGSQVSVPPGQNRRQQHTLSVTTKVERGYQYLLITYTKNGKEIDLGCQTLKVRPDK
jgi:hypothetical protein